MLGVVSVGTLELEVMPMGFILIRYKKVLVRRKNKPAYFLTIRYNRVTKVQRAC